MKLSHWALASLAIVPFTANAFETRLNGFISVGAGMTLKDGQEFTTDPVNAGKYTNELSIKPDTMVALQTLSQVNDRLSATAQLVGFAGTDFDVNFEWAYMNYELTNDISVKAGRIRMPVFSYSSSLDLGYSYTWIRPPVEVYNVFLTSLEGISVDYNLLLGDWYTTASVYYGETSGTDPETQSLVEFESILGGSLTLNNGNLTLRGSASVDDDVTALRTGTTTPIDLPLGFYSASALYDNGTFLVNSEYTFTDFRNDLNNNETAWFATTGMRVGSFTPHFTLSSFKQSQNSTFMAGPFAVSDYPHDISAYTIGVRWDFDIAASAKIEYTSRKDNTVDAPIDALDSPYGDAQAISVAVDVVF
ncbi:hypothetical protein [Reinekea sp.]|jgi:hypothetical protein|uniref:hypothetical protein n=1 Tax=Reinekea sp. TaxID=1970455 RepID=UPI003989087C